MEKDFDYNSFIKKMVSFSPRQLRGETKTADFLESVLNTDSVPFTIHSYIVFIPLTTEAKLYADKKSVPCEGCSMASGAIQGNYKIISSLISSSVLQEEPNINFNPKCKIISKSNHYFAPSVAISHRGLAKVLSAQKVHGEVRVQKIRHTARDILIGNRKNPKTVCFAHYDSIETGAIDNASGVAVMMQTILENPKLLENALFVFAANEELSYDKPVYWGHGFRVFEKKYNNTLDRAKKIVVIDCVGNGKTVHITDIEEIKLAFPIRKIKRWKRKIIMLSGDFDSLMTVYHSKLDDGRGLSNKWLKDAQKALIEVLQ